MPAREQAAHAELTETRERLKRHAGSSKTFAASICGRTTERRRRRKRLSVQYAASRVLAQGFRAASRSKGEPVCWVAASIISSVTLTILLNLGLFALSGQPPGALRTACKWATPTHIPLA